MGFSHVSGPGSLNNTLFFQNCILVSGPHYGTDGQKSHYKYRVGDEEPRIAWVQLKGQAALTVLSMTCSNISSTKNFTGICKERKDPEVTKELLTTQLYPLIARIKDTSLDDRQGQHIFPVPEKTSASVLLLDPWGGFLSWLIASQWNQSGAITT